MDKCSRCGYETIKHAHTEADCIRNLQEKNERLQARVTNQGALIADYQMDSDDRLKSMMRLQIEIAELRERTQGVCRWRLTDDDHGWWTGDCGAEWIFEASDPNGNKMKFCPNCGRKLEQVEPEPEDDEIERLREALTDMLHLIDEHGSPVIRGHAKRILAAHEALKGGGDE